MYILIPEEPTQEVIEAMREARLSATYIGASGMTIDAQWRAKFAPELRMYQAILDKSKPKCWS